MNQKNQNEAGAAGAARAVAPKKSWIEDAEEGEILRSGTVDIGAVSIFNHAEVETFGPTKQPPKPRAGR
jgi:hypothetical protein